MKLEVCMYVRTTYGLIFKIKNVVKERNVITTYDDVFEDYDFMTNEIDIEDLMLNLKSYSNDLIKLIEEGDYVNGSKVIKLIPMGTSGDGLWGYVIKLENGKEIELIAKGNYANKIKTIVTKEQFQNSIYRVGDE